MERLQIYTELQNKLTLNTQNYSLRDLLCSNEQPDWWTDGCGPLKVGSMCRGWIHQAVTIITFNGMKCLAKRGDFMCNVADSFQYTKHYLTMLHYENYIVMSLPSTHRLWLLHSIHCPSDNEWVKSFTVGQVMSYNWYHKDALWNSMYYVPSHQLLSWAAKCSKGKGGRCWLSRAHPAGLLYT